MKIGVFNALILLRIVKNVRTNFAQFIQIIYIVI